MKLNGFYGLAKIGYDFPTQLNEGSPKAKRNHGAPLRMFLTDIVDPPVWRRDGILGTASSTERIADESNLNIAK